MKITNVQITLRSERRLCGFANVTFDDCFVVRGLKIIKGDNRHFVSMPAWRRRNGAHQDVAHPINGEMRDRLEREVLSAFETKVNGGSAGQYHSDDTRPQQFAD